MSPTTLEPSPDSPASSSSRALVSIGDKGIELTNIDELWRFSNVVAKSGLAPKGIQTPEAIFVAVQMGLEVGLPLMAALQNIAVINGRPAVWGDAMLAVVRNTRQLEDFEEWFEKGPEDRAVRLARNPMDYPDDLRAVCRVKRKGQEPTEVAFSVGDAKRAKLWLKEGPWTQYPFRMLKARARSFALRDQFGDALRGMRSVEELQDEPKTVAGRVVEDAVVPEAPSTPLLQEQVNLGERPAAAAKTGKGEPKSDAARATTEPAPERSQAAPSAPKTQEQAARPTAARKKAADPPPLELVGDPPAETPVQELRRRVAEAGLDVARVNEFLSDAMFPPLETITDDEANQVLRQFAILAQHTGGAQ